MPRFHYLFSHIFYWCIIVVHKDGICLIFVHAHNIAIWFGQYYSPALISLFNKINSAFYCTLHFSKLKCTWMDMVATNAQISKRLVRRETGNDQSRGTVMSGTGYSEDGILEWPNSPDMRTRRIRNTFKNWIKPVKARGPFFPFWASLIYTWLYTSFTKDRIVMMYSFLAALGFKEVHQKGTWFGSSG